MIDLDKVLRELVDEALSLAQHAPSNSNIQPWHVVYFPGNKLHVNRDPINKNVVFLDI